MSKLKLKLCRNDEIVGDENVGPVCKFFQLKTPVSALFTDTIIALPRQQQLKTEDRGGSLACRSMEYHL